MPSRATTARELLRRLTRDVPGTPKVVRHGRRAKMTGEGTGSIFLWPIQAIARKAKGKAKVDRALYEKLHRPLLNIDQKAGRQLEKEFGTKRLFRQVDVLPTGRKIKGQRALIEHERHSATAPLSKTVKAVTPLAAILYASNLMSKQSEDKTAEAQEVTGKEALLKQAADALEHAHIRQEAEKLAFEMVEQGRISPFQNFDQFQQKVASLMDKGIEIVREALDIESPAADFGKLAEAKGPSGSSPEAAFYHRLAGE